MRMRPESMQKAQATKLIIKCDQLNIDQFHKQFYFIYYCLSIQIYTDLFSSFSKKQVSSIIMLFWYLLQMSLQNLTLGPGIKSAQITSLWYVSLRYFQSHKCFYLWRGLDVANVFSPQRFPNLTSLIDPSASTDSLSFRLCTGALTANYCSLSPVQAPKKVNWFDDKVAEISQYKSLSPAL